MNSLINEIKGKLGFGCMRLPMSENEVDYTEFSKMVDLYISEGFNYFDTAHIYIDGKSEIALRECLVKRYPREKYLIANKLSNGCFKTEEDIVPFFNSQLEIMGLDYFDFYLMHAQNGTSYKKYVSCNAYKIASDLKKEGKIRHFGISFHDKAEVLDTILSEQPDVEFVQIQFNYADYDDPNVESRKCYEICRKYGKAVIVMEPVKGGCLVNLPEEGKRIFDALGGGSYASYAIRFAAGFEGIISVLSGMSNMEQLSDNVSYMKDFTQLSAKELDAVNKVKSIFNKEALIPCTSCRYCTDECPKNIPIPEVIAALNSYKRYKTPGPYYFIYTINKGKAKDCISCGKCEKACPQGLKIRDHLKTAASLFDK